MTCTPAKHAAALKTIEKLALSNRSAEESALLRLLTELVSSYDRHRYPHPCFALLEML